jgi:hypothetical protein
MKGERGIVGPIGAPGPIIEVKGERGLPGNQGPQVSFTVN